MQKPQFDAFNRLKWLMSTVPVLQFFDPNLTTRLRTDSGSFGQEAMIEQYFEDDWHPIAFASRALDKSEQSYAQIERETLSLVFACKRFHEYIKSFSKSFHEYIKSFHEYIKSFSYRMIISL